MTTDRPRQHDDLDLATGDIMSARPTTVEVSGTVLVGGGAPLSTRAMRRQVTWAELWALPSLRDAPIAGAELRHRR